MPLIFVIMSEESMSAGAPPRRWIAGIFPSRPEADAFLERAVARTVAVHELRELPSLSFPFAVMEDQAGFRFLTIGDLQHELDRIDANRVADDDWCYFNLYVVRHEFAPEPPGVDRMGMLRHWHVKTWHLDQYPERWARMVPRLTSHLDDGGI